MTRCRAFFSDETGAVTVDWVVLTAAIVAAAMLIWPVFHPAVADLSSGISGKMYEHRDNVVPSTN
jgi:Flp pilus assembly pilin Flp